MFKTFGLCNRLLYLFNISSPLKVFELSHNPDYVLLLVFVIQISYWYLLFSKLKKIILTDLYTLLIPNTPTIVVEGCRNPCEAGQTIVCNHQYPDRKVVGSL